MDAPFYQPDKNEQSLNALVCDYAPLVRRIAEQVKHKIPATIELDDLIQSGVIGLLEAKASYSPEHGASFKTYATMKIRYAIYEGLRKHSGITREISQFIKQIRNAIAQVEPETHVTSSTISTHMGITLKAYTQMTQEINAYKMVSVEELQDTTELADENSQNPMIDTARNKIKNMLKTAINDLPERERLILSLYYNDFLSFKEIGVVLDLTEARVSQLHQHILTKLRPRLAVIKDSLHEVI